MFRQSKRCEGMHRLALLRGENYKRFGARASPAFGVVIELAIFTGGCGVGLGRKETDDLRDEVNSR